MIVSHMMMALALAASPADGAASGAWTDFYNEPRTEKVPSDVRKLVIRAQGCGHFSGEVGDGNPPERVAEINKAMKKLCTGLPAKRRALLAKYPRHAAVQTLIRDIWNEYGFDE